MREPEERRPAQTAWWCWGAAALMDLGLGLSLGMYYTVTYYGRAAIPLPGFVALGAPFQYYVLVDEQQDTVIQAWLWMACFPFVGLLWRGTLALLGRCMRLPVRGKALAGAVWATTWPLLLPIPALVWMLGQADAGGLQWEAFVGACLRRQFVANAAWLTPVYFALALVALALELRALWRLAAGATVAKRLAWIAGAVVVLVGVVSGVGLGGGALVAR